MAGGVDITIKLDATKMRETLAGIRERLLDLKPVMEGRATAYETMSKRDVFNREQSPLGTKWDDIADSTKKRKGSAKILTDDGFLQNAINASATKSGIRVGVSGAPATYAATHQFGRGSIPRRPFLPLDEAGIAVATSGPMKTFMTRLQARVKKYVLKGEL